MTFRVALVRLETLDLPLNAPRAAVSVEGGWEKRRGIGDLASIGPKRTAIRARSGLKLEAIGVRTPRSLRL